MMTSDNSSLLHKYITPSSKQHHSPSTHRAGCVRVGLSPRGYGTRPRTLTTPAESEVFFDLEPLFVHPDDTLKPLICELHTQKRTGEAGSADLSWVVYHQQLYVRATQVQREWSTKPHSRNEAVIHDIWKIYILIPKLDVFLPAASIQLQHLFWGKNLDPRETIHKVN